MNLVELFALNNKSYRRASDNLHFFTLRSPSSSSAVQLVSRDKDVSKDVMEYPLESVVLVQGTVKARRQKAKAISSAVDEIELEVQGVTLLNPADQTLPFYPNRPEVASFIKRLVEEAPLTICVFLFSLFFFRPMRTFELSIVTLTSDDKTLRIISRPGARLRTLSETISTIKVTEFKYFGEQTKD